MVDFSKCNRQNFCADCDDPDDGEISVTGRANAEAVRGYVNLVRDRIKRLPTIQPRIEALEAEKARADRLAEKLKSVVVENTLLKDALHKMGTAAQETDVWQMKLDAFYFRCKSMATCARCPVYTHKAVSTLCLRPSQEFTEAELDTLLACFGNTNKGGTDK